MLPVAVAFGIGLLTGSFLNVCIHRWPVGQSVVSPRSRCPSCSAWIAWHDNIPLLSYALLIGRCRHCEQRISVRYPVVELATAALFAMVVVQFGIGAEALKLAILGSMLLILFFTDLAHLILPDRVTLPGIGAGIGFSAVVPLVPGVASAVLLAHSETPSARWVSVTESALGAVVFGGILFLVGEAFYRLRGIEGLGLGDVKLIAMVAAFQGTSVALLVLLGACLLATAWGITTVALGSKGWRDPLPFGSFISGVAIACIFLADTLIDRYWEFVLS